MWTYSKGKLQRFVITQTPVTYFEWFIYFFHIICFLTFYIQVVKNQTIHLLNIISKSLTYGEANSNCCSQYYTMTTVLFVLLFGVFFCKGCCSQSIHYLVSNTMLRFAIIAVCIALSVADYDKKLGYGQGYGYGLNNVYVSLHL